MYSENSDSVIQTVVKQAAKDILMVRPAHFGFNPETSKSNPFQSPVDLPRRTVEQLAMEEFDAMVNALRNNGVEVYVHQDSPEPRKMDAVFPNNWISMHPDGKVFLYPMFAEVRRLERDPDILELLKKHFQVSSITDLSGAENQGVFLEGTGSIVFDHINDVAFACNSVRTDKALFHQHCESLGYKPLFFHASDQQGIPIYHTNVMMFVGSEVCAICLDSIADAAERQSVIRHLASTGHEIVELSMEQMISFAGNMLEVINKSGEKLLVMSKTAYESLAPEQLGRLEAYYRILPIKVDTIEEAGGGSVRCMMAEIFLPRK